MKAKKTLRTVSQETLQDLRLRVIEAITTKKMTARAASEAFGVGYSTILSWKKAVKDGGKKALTLKKRGKPKGSKEITPAQEKWVQKQIINKTPEQLILPFALWTRAAVRDLIKREFGIEKSLHQIGRYLKEWDFTPQKPIYKAYEQQSKQVKKWLDNDYPSIKEQAKKEGGEIFWEDEMGMRSDHQSGTTYGKKGKTPVIRKTGKRFRLNMISAISNKGKKYFQIYKDNFNGAKFLGFIRQLLKTTRKKIFMIVDSHPAHKTIMIKDWLSKMKHRIELFFLPGYSPELNPQEYMNHDVKANAVGKHRTLNADDLKYKVESYIQTRDRHTVKKYFQHPKVQYAA